MAAVDYASSIHEHPSKNQFEIWKLCEYSYFADECDLVSHDKGEFY